MLSSHISAICRVKRGDRNNYVHIYCPTWEIMANQPQSGARIYDGDFACASTDYRYRVIYYFVFAKRDAVVPVSRKTLPVLSHGAWQNFCPIGNVDRLSRRRRSSRTSRTLYIYVHTCVRMYTSETARLSTITTQ